MIRFITEHRKRFGVELICQVLRPAVRGFLTSRGFRAAVSRAPSARQLRDELLVSQVVRLHAENCGVYGRRRMHALLRRQGWEIGRDQTERLMRKAGVRGVKRSKRVFTTKPDPAIEKPKHLVQRRFTAPDPRSLWVAGVTSVAPLGFQQSSQHQRREAEMPVRKYTEQQRLVFLALLDRGGSVQAAALSAGVSPDRGYRWMKQAGLSTPRSTQRKHSPEDKAEFLQAARCERQRLGARARTQLQPGHLLRLGA